MQSLLIRIVGGLIISALLVVGTWYKTKLVYEAACVSGNQAAYIKERKRQDEIVKDVMRMDANELDAAWRGWMREQPHSPSTDSKSNVRKSR